jgi:hypothetical protein
MTTRILASVAGLSLMILAVGCSSGEPPSDHEIVWKIDNLKRIGGHEVRTVGEPRVVDVADGKAVEFDGLDDAMFLDVHPLAGAKQFTVEIIFRPDAAGPPEQRFFHMQENDSDDRVMFETRLTGDGQWFLDTFIKSGEGDYALFAEEFKHPVGQWYHAALVLDGEEMRHYVNGKQEMSIAIAYQPQSKGKTSLGVRINEVYWFKGAIRTARFTRRVLEPKEFLKP